MARSSKVAEANTAEQSAARLDIDIEIEHWPVERLIPRVNNPRTHSRDQVARIAASIREFDFTNPILLGAEDDIIAGHARLLVHWQAKLPRRLVARTASAISDAAARPMVPGSGVPAMVPLSVRFG